MSIAVNRVKLTGGNIRCHHLYVRGCEAVIPEGGVGGSNKKSLGRPFTVKFEPGPTVETDVDGSKMMLRDRTGVRAFFEAAAASEGDTVVIERTGERTLEIWMEHAA